MVTFLCFVEVLAVGQAGDGIHDMETSGGIYSPFYTVSRTIINLLHFSSCICDFDIIP